jgi:hypothetical protein
MDNTPTNEFLAACRLVLGADDAATVIGALQSDDSDLIERLDFTHRSIVKLAQISMRNKTSSASQRQRTIDLFLEDAAGCCSMCRQPFVGWGNNAQPINDGRCCSGCNQTVIIPARLAFIAGRVR